jgi:hypothetical protein
VKIHLHVPVPRGCQHGPVRRPLARIDDLQRLHFDSIEHHLEIG